MSSSPEATSDPRQDLLSLINGFQITQAIYVASTLQVADHLTDGARSAGELAALTGSHPDSLYRLMRALAAVGVFRESEGRKFALTPIGDCLRKDSEVPIGAWAEFVGSRYFWQAWGHLLHSVQTGKNAFRDLNGIDVWQFRAEHPEYGATFDRAMTQLSRGSAQAVIRAYDFSSFHHIVDVGGGQGLMLAAILNAYPHIRGTLFDQPDVVARAKAVLVESGIVDRCSIVGGNFFETVPEGADAYLMRVVIHDWEDDEAVAILKVCRHAMPEGAKLLLIEWLVGPPNEMPAAKFADLNMLVSPGGRERTREEFLDLFARSGFQLTRVIPAGTHHVIEAQSR
jgi:O-methyltransferase/methyltransferase family protein